jgi:hypothetical protein
VISVEPAFEEADLRFGQLLVLVLVEPVEQAAEELVLLETPLGIGGTDLGGEGRVEPLAVEGFDELRFAQGAVPIAIPVLELEVDGPLAIPERSRQPCHEKPISTRPTSFSAASKPFSRRGRGSNGRPSPRSAWSIALRLSNLETR